LFCALFVAAIVRSRRGASELLPNSASAASPMLHLYSGVPIGDPSFGIGQKGPDLFCSGQASVAICSRATALTQAMPVAF